jgi:hypothetical protein
MNGYTIGSDISNLVLQAGAPTARNSTGNSKSTGNDHSGWFDELGSNLILGNEFDNILSGGGVGGDANVGGFDTLTGGGGQDMFMVRGYINASNNRWDPVYAGDSQVWNPRASTYTDSDYVLITDFTGEDIINLGTLESLPDFVIGRAPGYVGENNLSSPDSTTAVNNFGIFRKSNLKGDPDLVAHVRTAGGLQLDATSLVPGNEFQPRAATDGSRGVFYEIAGVRFDDSGTPRAATDLFNPLNHSQTPSTASLSALMGQIV